MKKMVLFVRSKCSLVHAIWGVEVSDRFLFPAALPLVKNLSYPLKRE